MLNNPQVLNAILENPSIKPMLDSNPLMRSMLSNPQFLQTLMDPTVLQNMSNMMNTMNSSNTGFSFPNTNTSNTSSQNTQNTNSTTDSTNPSNTSTNNTTSSIPTNPFSQGSFPFPMFNPGFGFPFMNMNSMNNFTNPLVNNQNIDPKEKYKEQNQKLKEMGFINDDLNIEVLTKTGGNIDAAVERLLNML
jgi:ubiquilin